MTYILPGDAARLTDYTVDSENESQKTSIRLGHGLLSKDDYAFATVAGLLEKKSQKRKPDYFTVTGSRSRYIPVLNDSVIGQITHRSGEQYIVNIGAASNATLDFLAFDSATRRNRPNLVTGTLVYARIISAMPHLDTELSCESAGYGELKEGLSFSVDNLNVCNRLLSPDCVILRTIGERIAYEIAVGKNGRIWIKLDDEDGRVTFLLSRIIKECTTKSDSEVVAAINSIKINIIDAR